MKKPKYRLKNEEEIKSYLSNNKLNAQKSETGLYYLVHKKGEGVYPKQNSNITIAYIGYLSNGNIFDQSEKLEINLADVIKGWTEGIQYFREGEEGILLIPSHLAYGNTDYGSIPAGSVLIFDIHLLKVN
nr:FKBP-type peptidyl-prolyl cis-trans isomerase [uncultured Marinifilum sp.]